MNIFQRMKTLGLQILLTGYLRKLGVNTNMAAIKDIIKALIDMETTGTGTVPPQTEVLQAKLLGQNIKATFTESAVFEKV